LEYLFPDSVPKPEFPYPTEFSSHFEQSKGFYENCRVSLSAIKSSPLDGLAWRLTVVTAHCLHILGKIDSSQFSRALYSMLRRDSCLCIRIL
jgi:hypothetical protein